VTLAVALFCGAILGAPVQAMKVIVLGQNSEQLWIIDGDLGTVTGTIPLNDDPDGDRLPDPPTDVCSSTVPGSAGQHAFVLQDEFIRVIDLRSEAIVQTHDIASRFGLPDLKLVACHASAPQHFEPKDPSNPPGPTLTFLHVIANETSTGEARFVVLRADAVARQPHRADRRPLPGQRGQPPADRRPRRPRSGAVTPSC
jgi:hypothetical protein